ncbi:MAG: hypothetical protein FH756_10285 [Firmicutes bacterium]|nr:hypothetical protein [Bacillota bacterium]
MLPDDVHVTVDIAAEYYGVQKQTIKNLIFDHMAEMVFDGMQVLRGADLKEFKARFLEETNLENKYKFAPSLTLLPRQAVLRIGMLFRDSEVARRGLPLGNLTATEASIRFER